MLFAGETIPIRLFLGGFDLTPTFREVNKKFSTRYYLSLVLIDEGKADASHPTCTCHSLKLAIDARRYFKQSEIVLYRQSPEQQQHPAPQPQLPAERAITDQQQPMPSVPA